MIHLKRLVEGACIAILVIGTGFFLDLISKNITWLREIFVGIIILASLYFIGMLVEERE